MLATISVSYSVPLSLEGESNIMIQACVNPAPESYIYILESQFVLWFMSLSDHIHFIADCDAGMYTNRYTLW